MSADQPRPAGTEKDRQPCTAKADELRAFLAALVADSPGRLAWVITVQLVAAVIQGVGLLLLVPLLEMAGVSKTTSAGGVVNLARHAFGVLGVPFTLGAMLVLYVAVVAGGAGVNAYQSVLLVRYRLEFVDGQRSRLYRAVATAEWRYLVGLRQSDLLTALVVDVNWVGQGTLAALNLGVAVIVATVELAIAVRLSPAVTGLAALTGAALFVLVWPLVGRSRRLGRDLLAENRGVLAAVTGFFDGLKLAKAHGLESGHLGSFDGAIVRSRRAQIDYATASAAATAVQVAVTALVLAVLVDVAVVHVGLPLAELLVLAFIFTRLVPQVTRAQSQIQSLAQALPAFNELTSVIDGCDQAAEVAAHPRPAGSPPLLQERLAFDHVSFAYRRADGRPVEVLHDVTVCLPANTTTAVVGPSGAGKTTMADLAVGLLAPSFGQLHIDGTPLTAELLAEWRAAVAMVPQEAFLFHDSVRANLRWAQPRATEAEMWDALTLSSAEAFVRRLPEGLDTVVGDRGGRLSGGERQRIALARALLRRPALLVLDEATNSLDAGNETAILDALAQLHGRMTMLVIAHQASALRHADHVITLSGGRVVDTRTRELVGERPGRELVPD